VLCFGVKSHTVRAKTIRTAPASITAFQPPQFHTAKARPEPIAPPAKLLVTYAVFRRLLEVWSRL
jgi:hypothetical protein